MNLTVSGFKVNGVIPQIKKSDNKQKENVSFGISLKEVEQSGDKAIRFLAEHLPIQQEATDTPRILLVKIKQALYDGAYPSEHWVDLCGELTGFEARPREGFWANLFR